MALGALHAILRVRQQFQTCLRYFRSAVDAFHGLSLISKSVAIRCHYSMSCRASAGRDKAHCQGDGSVQPRPVYRMSRYLSNPG